MHACMLCRWAARPAKQANNASVQRAWERGDTQVAGGCSTIALGMMQARVFRLCSAAVSGKSAVVSSVCTNVQPWEVL